MRRQQVVVSWKKEVFSPTEGKHDGLAQGEHHKQDRLHKNFLVLSSNF